MKASIHYRICVYFQTGLHLGNQKLRSVELLQLDATYYFIMLMLESACFGHHYAHHRERTMIALVTT